MLHDYLNKKLLAITGLSILAFILSVLFIREPVLMAPDSAGYLGFGIQRPCGYPFFLAGFKAIFGSFAALPFIQLAFYYGAMAYLIMSLTHLTQKWIYMLLAFAGLGVNYPFIKMAFFILPESISISLLMLTLAVFLRFCVTRHIKYLIWGITFISLGFLCKPVFKFMLVLPAMMLILFFRERFTVKNMMIIYIPAVIFGGLGSGVQYHKHRFWGTEDFLGHNLLGKAGLVAAKNTPSTMPPFMTPFEEESLRIQAFLQQAPWKLKFVLKCPLYDHMRYPFLGKVATTTELRLTDRDYQTLAFEVIQHNPWEYLQDVGLNYIAAWGLLELRTTAETEQLYAFLDQHRTDIPSPIFDYFQGFRFFKRYYGDIAAYVTRFFMGLACLFSVYFGMVGLYKGVRRKTISNAEIFGFLAASIVQGGFVTICLLQAALPRYILLFWPCIILLLVLGCRELILRVYPYYEKA